RFTEQQKTKVFRSMVKEARMNDSSIELELYAKPTENELWKYRQKTARKRTEGLDKTVRVGIPQEHPPIARVYTTAEVAQVLGISKDVLRLRIKTGKYPVPPRSNGNQRQFTDEHLQQLRKIS